jgi:hypothetical protein
LREIHIRKKRTPFSLPQYWGNNRNPVKDYSPAWQLQPGEPYSSQLIHLVRKIAFPLQ